MWLIGHDDAASDVDGYGVMTWGYSLESGGREALVDELYVRHRGAGVGAAALNEMLASAAAAGARRVFLETERHNTRVRSFYARLGFQTDDSVWMSRDLTSHDAVVRGVPPEEIELPTVGARLRRHHVDDLDAVHEAIELSRDHLRPWMPWADQTRQETGEFLERSVAEWDAGHDFGYIAIDDADRSVVGGTGLHSRIGEDGLEIGYWRRVGCRRARARDDVVGGPDTCRLRPRRCGTSRDPLRRGQRRQRRSASPARVHARAHRGQADRRAG